MARVRNRKNRQPSGRSVGRSSGTRSRKSARNLDRGDGQEQSNPKGKTPPEQNPTRLRIIEAARKLFYENGYHATGVAEVLRQADAGSGSMYFFFRSKEDLLLAVLDTYADRMQAEVFEPAFKQTRDPIKRVLAVVAGYRILLESTQCKRGCPIGNLALEVDDMPEVRERIAVNFDNWCAVVAECFRKAGYRFPRNTDVTALSRFVLTAMEGGIMQARAYRSIEPFDACIDQLTRYIKLLTKTKNK